MKVKDLKGFPKVESTEIYELDTSIAYANGFNIARSTIGNLEIPEINRKEIKRLIQSKRNENDYISTKDILDIIEDRL